MSVTHHYNLTYLEMFTKLLEERKAFYFGPHEYGGNLLQWKEEDSQIAVLLTTKEYLDGTPIMNVDQPDSLPFLNGQRKFSTMFQERYLWMD